MATCTITSSGGNDPSLVKLRIPLENKREDDNGRSRIILVIDRSGSMAGGPWTQVQSAAKAIQEIIQQQEYGADCEPIVITYNSTVSVTNLSNFARISAVGNTDFIKAFEQVRTTVQSVGSGKRVVIIFMTDGCDTCNRADAIVDAQNNLRLFLRNCGSNCIVHVIGYSNAHDLNMMNTLKTLGSNEGVYRYAEGSAGLDEKFRELFEFAGTTVELTLKMVNMTDPIKMTGELIDGEYVDAECWISLNEKNEEAVIVKLGANEHRIVPTFEQANAVFSIKALSNRAKNITNQQELDQIQLELNAIEMFGDNLVGNRVEREAAVEARAELQARLNKMHTIMGDIARGTLNQTSALAKMNDLRYADKFSKLSRQRRMDQRAVRNMANLKLIDGKLDALKFDPINDFANVDLSMFTCCLTLKNCRDLMVDSHDDIMGVGIVVKRKELVVDTPTLISIKSVSVSILSRSACDDATKMKLDIDKEAQPHGGFILRRPIESTATRNVVQQVLTDDSSVITRGVAAEPINAFLPLYICDAHFERVKVMLEPMLGYLFTLDIAGYSPNQILGLYSILGQMMNDSEPNASERQEFILKEYTRLCHELLDQTRQYLGEGNDILQKFIDSPAGRTKNQLPSMMTLFGYMHAIGIDNIDESLRYAIVQELYRRHFLYKYRDAIPRVIDGHLRDLLYSTDDQQQANAINYNQQTITPMNNKIREKMAELIADFDVQRSQNVLKRLGIQLMDITNEQDCLILRPIKQIGSPPIP
ncbi:unnamed protein product [Rotaria sp. Silwood1]|nr:unnamed protein product [Rotaria sp. Silwood1]